MNINSTRNKFELLEDVINRKKLGIILLSEAKLDDSFSSTQFISKWYGGAPYSISRNSKGGGLLFYIREDIPSNFLKLRSDCICVEINFRKWNWLIHNGSYNPDKSFISNLLECLNRIIDETAKHQTFLILGEFNATTNEKCMEEFCYTSGLTSLIKNSTCFKNLDKSTCTDLMYQPN